MSFRKQITLLIFILIAWIGSFWVTAYLWHTLPDWTLAPLAWTEVVITIIALLSAALVISIEEVKHE